MPGNPSSRMLKWLAAATNPSVLVDKQGVVRWAKNYPSMWVSPKDLLSQIRDV